MIPILFCNGNHDLKEENIQIKKQFIDYSDFIVKHQEEFRINLSENFYENQASFIDFPKKNMLFISLNSCHNIITNKEQDFKKPATLPYKLTDEFFMELKKQHIKEFQFRNKFIVIHHPLEKLKEHLDSIRVLKENNINLLFAGDSHKYSEYHYEDITGLTAGTLYGSNKIKWDSLNLQMRPNQFNYYEINAIDNNLSIFQYINDLQTSRWRLNSNSSLNIQLRGAWDLSSWCDYLKINSILKELKSETIKTIIEDTSKSVDFIAIRKDNEIIKIFVQENVDQQKVKLIKSYIKDKKMGNKYFDFKVIDKTGRLKGQLPSEFILECANNDESK